MKQSWQADHPGSESGLYVGLPQNPPHLWIIGAGEEDELTDPKQQDFHGTGQYDTQEKPQREPIIGGVAETRGHKSDQRLLQLSKDKWTKR